MISCKHCGSNNLQIKIHKFNGGEHHQAICEHCGKFSHNIPHQPPKLYFGKYKGQLLSEITDSGYLKWFVENTKITASMKQAVLNRISEIEYNSK